MQFVDDKHTDWFAPRGPVASKNGVEKKCRRLKSVRDHFLESRIRDHCFPARMRRRSSLDEALASIESPVKNRTSGRAKVRRFIDAVQNDFCGSMAH